MINFMLGLYIVWISNKTNNNKKYKIVIKKLIKTNFRKWLVFSHCSNISNLYSSYLIRDFLYWLLELDFIRF